VRTFLRSWLGTLMWLFGGAGIVVLVAITWGTVPALFAVLVALTIAGLIIDFFGVR